MIPKHGETVQHRPQERGEEGHPGGEGEEEEVRHGEGGNQEEQGQDGRR